MLQVIYQSIYKCVKKKTQKKTKTYTRAPKNHLELLQICVRASFWFQFQDNLMFFKAGREHSFITTAHIKGFVWNEHLKARERKQHCSRAVFHRPVFISHSCCLQERQMWTRTMGPPRRAQRWQTPKAQQTRRMPGPRPTQLTGLVAPTWSASFPEMPQEEKTTPSKIGPQSQTSYRPSKRTVQQLRRIRIWWLHKNVPLSGTDQNWHLRAL